MDSHAKVPWILGESVEGDPIILAEDRLIAIVPVAFSSESGAWSTYKSRNAKADFEFIVCAVNAYEKDQELIKAFADYDCEQPDGIGCVRFDEKYRAGSPTCWPCKARQAIANVGRK